MVHPVLQGGGASVQYKVTHTRVNEKWLTWIYVDVFSCRALQMYKPNLRKDKLDKGVLRRILSFFDCAMCTAISAAQHMLLSIATHRQRSQALPE